MRTELWSASGLTLEELAYLFNRSFEAYVVPVQMSAPALLERLRVEGVDYTVSRVLAVDGEPVGLALLARRGERSRLAAMGITPGFRRRGLGRWLMERLLAEARGRGEVEMLLEVIETNPPAVRLYEAVGFRRLERLVGFELDARGEVRPAEGDAGLEEVSPQEVARHLCLHGPPELPWMISWQSMAQLALPDRAFRLGPAWAVVSDPRQATVSVRSLVVETGERRRGRARSLLTALRARFPERRWRVGPLVPEDLAPGLFESAGFARMGLTQLHMACRLGAA